jgi:hypothetical protein
MPAVPSEVLLQRIALVLALLIAAAPAHAAGAGIRWSECEGPSNRNFACDRSTGSEVLVGSFQTPVAGDLLGIEVNLRITSPQGAVPPWWHMWEAGDCRRNSSSLSVDVSGETACDDPWFSDRGLDMLMVIAVPAQAVQTISPGRTYAAFRLTINHARSSGDAACEGCQTPACIAIERLVLALPNKIELELTEGITGVGGAGNIATWQGGTPTCSAGARKSSSWSELKKHYR